MCLISIWISIVMILFSQCKSYNDKATTSSYWIKAQNSHCQVLAIILCTSIYSPFHIFTAVWEVLGPTQECHTSVTLGRFVAWVTKQIFFFLVNFLPFSKLLKHCLLIKYHIHIYQVSLQLSCSDTCQICMWFSESQRYFCKSKVVLKGETNKLRVSTQ